VQQTSKSKSIPVSQWLNNKQYRTNEENMKLTNINSSYLHAQSCPFHYFTAIQRITILQKTNVVLGSSKRTHKSWVCILLHKW